MSTSPTPLRVALDWTPNTLHTGLYAAEHLSLFARAGLAVTLLPPDPSYSTTPARLVASGAADLAICPSESCIAYAHSGGPTRLQAIYAILAHDASAIVSKTLSRPRELAAGGRKYGSYGARYEDDIVRAMIEADGGSAGEMQVVGEKEVGKLDLFTAVRAGDGRVDATWVFLPWEGLEADMAGERLAGVWRMEEYGVPYGPSPVIARDAAAGRVSDEALRAFVGAVRQGYAWARERPEEAALLLDGQCNPAREPAFLVRSQKVINAFYGNGRMEDGRWEKWVEWLRGRGLLGDGKVEAKSLYTNEFFD